MEYVPVQISSGCLKDLVVGDKVFRSAFDFRLSEKDLEICRKELKETKNGSEVSLQKLKEMLRNDPDFKYREDDAYLLRYLRYRKFRVEAAYGSLRCLYVTRQKYPDQFGIAPNLESLLRSNILTVLPYTDEQGCVLSIFRLGRWNPDEMHLRDLVLIGNLMCDMVTLNPSVQTNGWITIWDFGEPTFKKVSHALKYISPSMFMKILQEMYPWRTKGAILFNCNRIIHPTLVTVRWLLKQKVAERLVVLRSDLNELHQHVNPALLPKEYGGRLEDEECYTYWNDILLGNLPYLQYEHSFSRTHNQ